MVEKGAEPWQGTIAVVGPGLVAPGVSQGRVKGGPCSSLKIFSVDTEKL